MSHEMGTSTCTCGEQVAWDGNQSRGMGASSVGWEQVVWNGNKSHGLETSCMGWEPVTCDVSK